MEMKRFQSVFRRAVLALSVVLCLSNSAFADDLGDFDVLMWQVSDPKDDSGNSFAWSEKFQFARVAATRTDGTSSDVVYLNFYSQDQDDNWVLLPDSDTMQVYGTESGLATGGSTAYADLNKLGEDYRAYSFAIELGNYSEETGDWLLAATSEKWDYGRLYESGYIQDQLAIPDQGSWAGGTYTIPEPTSGLLMLFGCSLLALRRRKNLVAGTEIA